MLAARRAAVRIFAIAVLFGLPALLPVNAQQSSSAARRPGSKPVTGAAPDATSPSAVPQDPSTAKLSNFAWLEGRWRGEWGPRTAEQTWMAPIAGTLVGTFRLVEMEKPLVIELFTLVQRPDGINFYFRHFTPELVPWEKSEATLLNLTSLDTNKFVFENRVSGMPKSATLTRINADTYISRSELISEKGDPQTIEITYHRQPPAATAASGGNGARPKKP